MPRMRRPARDFAAGAALCGSLSGGQLRAFLSDYRASGAARPCSFQLLFEHAMRRLAIVALAACCSQRRRTLLVVPYLFAMLRPRAATRGRSGLRCGVAAGRTRIRPVLMTAAAMIVGMVPMAIGGAGEEQNAALARAVIGGMIEGDVIECCMHMGSFHIPTGMVMQPPCEVPLRTYQVVLRDEDVLADLTHNAAGEAV